MAKQQQAELKPPPVTVAVTYYGKRMGGKWEVYRVEVDGDGSMRSTRVLEHPERRVVREHLLARLNTGEVLP